MQGHRHRRRGQVGAGRRQSSITADEIAAAVLAGIDAGRRRDRPDEPARRRWRPQAGRPPAYDAVMRATGGAALEGACRRLTWVAGAGPVRDEDAFDVRGRRGLAARARRRRDGLDGTPEVRQFSGGASNLTYLLRYRPRDLILRRAARRDEGQGAHDMGREYRIQCPARAGLRLRRRRWSPSARTRR